MARDYGRPARIVLRSRRSVWTMHSSELRAILGLGAHLPLQGMLPQVVDGVTVYVTPAPGIVRAHAGARRGSRPHRVMAICPTCARHLPAGRLHQHICRPAPVAPSALVLAVESVAAIQARTDLDAAGAALVRDRQVARRQAAGLTPECEHGYATGCRACDPDR